MNVREALIRPLVTVGPRDFARHAGGLMDDFGISMLPVVDGDVFLGVVTRVDVTRGEEGVQAPFVQQVMSLPELVATVDTPAAALFDAMSRCEVRCVPVLDDGRVVGVATWLSVLELMSRNTEAGRAAVHS